MKKHNRHMTGKRTYATLFGALLSICVASSAAKADTPGQEELKAGLSANSNGRYAEAIQHFSQALNAGLPAKTNFVVRLLRVQAYTASAQNKKALGDCLQLQRNLTQSSDKQQAGAVHAWKGYNELELGMCQPAVKDLEQAVAFDQKSPTEARSRAWLGHAYQATGRYKDAVQQYSKAIALNSKVAEAYKGRATAYRHLGQDHLAEIDENKYQSAQRYALVKN